MLSNAYFLAKFRFDTAENEPAKNLQKFANFANFANPNPKPLKGGGHGGGRRAAGRGGDISDTAEDSRLGGSYSYGDWVVRMKNDGVSSLSEVGTTKK